MAESLKPYIKWKRPVIKSHVLYVSTCMKCWELDTSIEAKRTSAFAGLRGGECGVTTDGWAVSSGGDENVLKLDYCDDDTILWINTTELYTLQGWREQYMN